MYVQVEVKTLPVCVVSECQIEARRRKCCCISPLSLAQKITLCPFFTHTLSLSAHTHSLCTHALSHHTHRCMAERETRGRAAVSACTSHGHHGWYPNVCLWGLWRSQTAACLLQRSARARDWWMCFHILA